MLHSIKTLITPAPVCANMKYDTNIGAHLQGPIFSLLFSLPSKKTQIFFYKLVHNTQYTCFPRNNIVLPSRHLCQAWRDANYVISLFCKAYLGNVFFCTIFCIGISPVLKLKFSFYFSFIFKSTGSVKFIQCFLVPNSQEKVLKTVY